VNLPVAGARGALKLAVKKFAARERPYRARVRREADPFSTCLRAKIESDSRAFRCGADPECKRKSLLPASQYFTGDGIRRTNVHKCVSLKFRRRPAFI